MQLKCLIRPVITAGLTEESSAPNPGALRGVVRTVCFCGAAPHWKGYKAAENGDQKQVGDCTSTRQLTRRSVGWHCQIPISTGVVIVMWEI